MHVFIFRKPSLLIPFLSILFLKSHSLIQNLYYHNYSDYLYLHFSTLDFFICTVHLALTYMYSALQDSVLNLSTTQCFQPSPFWNQCKHHHLHFCYSGFQDEHHLQILIIYAVYKSYHSLLQSNPAKPAFPILSPS